MINDKKRKENRMCITTKVECRLGKFAKRNMHHTLFVLFSVCLSVCFVLFPTATTTTHT